MNINRLRIIIILFCLALAAPSAYFIRHARMGMEQEERGALQFFADTILDYMEEDLARLVEREEGRAVDDYAASAGGGLSMDSVEGFIVGYLQNNPDGSFTTPYGDDPVLVRQLQSANGAFNKLRMERREVEDAESLTFMTQAGDADQPPAPAPEPEAKPQISEEKTLQEKQEIAQVKKSFVERYLDPLISRQSKEQLGQKGRRVEEISIEQASNMSNKEMPSRDVSAIQLKDEGSDSAVVYEDTALAVYKPGTDDLKPEPSEERSWSKPKPKSSVSHTFSAPGASALAESMDPAPKNELGRQSFLREDRFGLPASREAAQKKLKLTTDAQDKGKLRVEVDPLQSMVLDHERILLFRRIVLDNRVYNQGMLIDTSAFLGYLNEVYFARQPMARYSTLTLSVMDRGVETNTVTTGKTLPHLVYRAERVFPRPFSFLVAAIECHDLPKSAGRRTLNIMQGVFWFVVLAGLFAIYRSAAAVMDYSRRRSQFVSSVTHELKTPLTNIRMYVEMLEMGIAKDTEREQEYLQVLGSESSRLSRLITNVLQFARLENKKSVLELQEGDLSEVLAEVRQVMGERLRSEGFVLEADKAAHRPFQYDREAMVQILVNLVENSVKFGKDAQDKEVSITLEQEPGRTKVKVSDKGPGIPKKALKKVFKDFFRVDNSLTRTTRGTGIGLALVRRFTESMGGRVTAENNPGPGCTITLHLPS